MFPLRESIYRVLHWSERYTKTDLAYLFAGGSWLVFAQIMIGVISFGLSIAFAHFVPKDVYGTYRFLLSVFWTITAFSLTGLPTAVSQAVARGFDGAYSRAFRLSFVWGLPLAGIAAVMSGYYFLNDNPVLGWGSLVIAIFGPFMQMSLLYGAFLEGKKDFKRMSLYGILLNAFSGMLILVAMFFTSSPLAFLAAYLFGNVAAGLFFCLLAWRKYRPTRASNPELSNLSFHFSLMNILSTLSQQIDKLLVFHYLGATQLAVYSFAIALPEQAKTFVNSISTLAFPKFAQRPMNEIGQNFWKRLWLFTGALAIAALVYMIVAPILFHLFFPKYLEAIIYSQIFAISLIFVSNTIPPTLLQAHAEQRDLYIFNIGVPVFQIIALVICTVMYGLVGTIAARILSRGFALLLGALLVRRHTRA